MTDTTIERVDTITTADVEGLVGTDSQPVSSNVDAQIAAAVEARTRRLRAFLAAVAPLPDTGKVWVPDLAAATGGGRQDTEKTEFPPADLSVLGQTYTPDLVGGAWNVSWQVMSAAGASIEVLLRELALRRAVDHVLGVLQDEATSAADLDGAVQSVEAAGYPVDIVMGSTSALLGLDVMALRAIGVTLFGGLPLAGVLVGSLAGVWGSASDVVLRQAEPAIGGFEVGAFVEVVVVAATGALALIPDTP